MSCSVTERVTDTRGQTTPSSTGTSNTAAVCRLRGTSNSNLTSSPNSRSAIGQPQNGPQNAAQQGTPLRPKPCCLWCCCCKCPCSNPNNRATEGNGPSKSSNDKEKHESTPPPTLEEIKSWSRSFDKLMRNPAGRDIFRDFLRGEYSEENILFWLACEELKRETNSEVVEEKARTIYEDYISILSPKEVSLDSRVREIVNRNMVEPTPQTFDEAQLQIYTLMHRDSYPRFVNSPMYRALSQSQNSNASQTQQTSNAETSSVGVTTAVVSTPDRDRPRDQDG